MSQFFIIDTNIVVAGVLTAHSDSPVARILDGMLGAAFGFVLSEPLLSEYRAVLLRPHLQKMHGLTEVDIDTVLIDLARHAIVLNPVADAVLPRAPDPGDQFLWDLLCSRTDLVLVTGDKLLLADTSMQPRVMSAQTFVAQLWH
ncbi:MAG: putative toxin-antitoxin system toxin component, PIN family [Rhodoferax sp.]|uniref:putative toxin-antitoxin system toxin component, PIN family n=1 Tax=Rhodoferax sp. TaxID=50421 RepID=UPI00260E025E|nr:putative toxin-antitoxin system toxin component, PIN family [Rhodoferax sp.]MDD2879127.1 putative toxin-antitoxin system toxin component, PIN family [Rhodoferax sp.]